MEQDRDTQGRFYSPERKTHKISIRIELFDYRVLRYLATEWKTTIPNVLTELIEDAYMEYATKGTIPDLYAEDDKLSVWYSFRVTQATRSMLWELAEMAGASLSEMIRSILAEYEETH